MGKIELKAIYDSHKEFYKKAYYIMQSKNNSILYILYSYNTQVLELKVNSKKRTFIFDYNRNISNSLMFSQTTTRHCVELLKQFLPSDYKKNIINKNYIKKYAGKTIIY